MRGYPWVGALAAGAVGMALYFFLPVLAPLSLIGQTNLILLGIILGLVVGFAVRLPYRLVPAVSIGALLGVTVRFDLEGTSLFDSFGVGVGVAVEIWVLVTLLRRTGAARLATPGDVLWLISIAVVVALVVATLGALFLQVTGEPVDSFWHSIRTWALDDIFGLLVVAPAVMLLQWPRQWSWHRAPEFMVFATLALVATVLLFYRVESGNPGLLGWPYLVILPSLWIAVRLGASAVTPVNAVVYWIAAVATVDGFGAFSEVAGDVLDQLATVELFGVVMCGSLLTLGVLRDAQVRSLSRVDEASRLLREVIDGADALVFAKAYDNATTAPSRYVLVNHTWAGSTGRSEADTIGYSDTDLWPAETAASFMTLDREVMVRNLPIEAEEASIDATGQLRHYLSSKFPLRNADGTVWGVGGVATDITELLLARQREQRQAELLHAVFELSPTPAVRMSFVEGVGLKVEAANAAMCTLLGAEIGNVADCDLMDHVHPEDTESAFSVLSMATRYPGAAGAPTVRQRELRMRTMEDRTLWVLMSAAAVPGSSPGELEVVAQFEDYTARRAAEEALSDQALRDAVTGLPNRRALHERMDSALQRLRRHPGMVTVLFCDLDHFKDVNDSLGHAVGDGLLIEVAERLTSALRPEDTIARLGGDEFVALGEGITDAADAVLLALRLQDKLSAPWLHGHQVFRPAMSVGIAMTSDPDVSVDEMLRRADLAMYRAKEGGRNRIELYERSVDDEVQHAVSMQHQLRRAIDTGGLVLHYQPIVRLDDGVVVGAEALVRLRLDDGSLLGPVDFVPQAEVTGLVVPMGAWVIQQALTDLLDLRGRGRDLTMSINVSPTQLREEGFARFLLEQVTFAGVEPEWLSLEVTETALIHDPGRSGRELAQLHDAGIRVSLDDFGTGYSSLSWLTQFPVSVVKIDKSFTDDIGIDERKSAIVSAVIAVSHELGFIVVAEGIETAEQSRRLLELGCDRGQGYLYGKPTPIEEPPWT
jgi:diguanylate cyclase (GGDEF)-like protein